MTFRLRALAGSLALAAGLALPAMAAAGDEAPSPQLLYVHSGSAMLPGGEPDWDYIRLDQDSGRLFLARHDDGLTVFDINSGKATGTVPESTGANGPLTLTDYHRGFVAMTDGTALVFDLKTLKPLAHVKLDAGEMNGSIYDPATRHVIVATGRRPRQSIWFIFDAASGTLLGNHVFDSTKMDDAVADGKGTIYAPMRDRNVVLKLRSSDLAE